MNRNFVAAAFLILAQLPALAISSAEPAAAFPAASAAFTRAVAGDGNATDQALKAFEALAAAAGPEAPLYQAYMGAAQTLQGRDAWMPWTKMKATERGLDTIDKALRRLEPQHDKALVNGIPVSLETRLVAATSFVAVPDMMFHRADSGRQLLQDMMKSPLYAQAPAGFRQQVEALAAKARK